MARLVKDIATEILIYIARNHHGSRKSFCAAVDCHPSTLTGIVNYGKPPPTLMLDVVGVFYFREKYYLWEDDDVEPDRRMR